MSRLFFKDRRACVKYFNALNVLIAPQAVKLIFECQRKGFRVVDHFSSAAVQDGYLTEDDIVMAPAYSALWEGR